MHRLSARRSSTVTEDLLAAALAFGMGFLGGVAVAALVGNLPGERLRGTVRGLRKGDDQVTGRRAAERIMEALASDPTHQDLRVILVRRDQVELHGWVRDRNSGTRALRVATLSAPAIQITNRIRVRGEDDLTSATAEPHPQT